MTDIPKLLKIEDASFVGYYRAHRFTEADFARYLGHANVVFLVAHDRDALTGYVVGFAPIAGHPQTARLDSIAVLPGRRGHGAGRQLLQRFMRTASLRGCRRMTLEVAVRNERARQLFEQAGFRPTRRLLQYYGGTADAVRLQAAL